MPGCIYTSAVTVPQPQHVTATFPSLPLLIPLPLCPRPPPHPQSLAPRSLSSFPFVCVSSRLLLSSLRLSLSVISSSLFSSPVPHPSLPPSSFLPSPHFSPPLLVLLPFLSTRFLSCILSLPFPCSPHPSCLLLSSSLCLTGREITLIPAFN